MPSYKAYVDYSDLGMDPEILRRKAAAISNANGKIPVLKTGNGIPQVAMAATIHLDSVEVTA